jgi:hypothetical protein
LSLAPADVQARLQYAKALAEASIIPTQYQRKPANVLVAIETGNALGIPAIQALNSIAVINGRATLSADLMAAVVRRAGHRLRVREDGPESVTATLIRADDPDGAFTATWTREKATRAGLWGNRGPWTQYPTQMLRARAITEVCRQGASDALMGLVYTPEELGARLDDAGAPVVDARGRVIIDQPAPRSQERPPAPAAPGPAARRGGYTPAQQTVIRGIRSLDLNEATFSALVRRVCGQVLRIEALDDDNARRVVNEMRAIWSSIHDQAPQQQAPTRRGVISLEEATGGGVIATGEDAAYYAEALAIDEDDDIDDPDGGAA